MSEPSTARRWLVRLRSLALGAGGLSALLAAGRALLAGAPPAPGWVWAAVVGLALVGLIGALALAALHACWPSQSAHRMELLQTLLRRRSTP
ncbi:hypothetical protein NE857_34115 (plasmid) [Nocardiopsis exhalans]|uniref:Uncharacterized protein n=1 Tax=Nocardiopsis exhalans TaxID=163604 RepID=A0ABY5DJY0_9ACTN|nr:hypothetical protein [Nocardiopsis exhalans]USY23570.1 hypothetical protein NE857_34115 [Nocardiopsis exhalans]